MIPKQKLCNGCNQMKVIWKAHGKEKYCKDCWYSIERPKALAKPTSKPNPVSKKMSKTMSEYERKRVAFFALHPFCQARLAGCTIGVAQIHHKAGRGENHNNMSTWLGVCASCHEYIELHPNEAKELGFSVNRLDKE
jgi:hypothetical protein